MKKLVSRESLDLMQHFVDEQNLLKKYLISLRLKKTHPKEWICNFSINTVYHRQYSIIPEN